MTVEPIVEGVHELGTRNVNSYIIGGLMWELGVARSVACPSLSPGYQSACFRSTALQARAFVSHEAMSITVDFELDGQAFTAINGGSRFPFTEAVSLLIECKDQAEIDRC